MRFLECTDRSRGPFTEIAAGIRSGGEAQLVESVLDVPNRVPDVADPIKSHEKKGIRHHEPGTRHQASGASRKRPALARGVAARTRHPHLEPESRRGVSRGLPASRDRVRPDNASFSVFSSNGRHGAGAPCSEEVGGWGPDRVLKTRGVLAPDVVASLQSFLAGDRRPATGDWRPATGDLPTQ